MVANKYYITQKGIEAFNRKYLRPVGDWAQRYGHILLNDFQNEYKDGLTEADVRSLFGTIGFEYFEELRQKGYFESR